MKNYYIESITQQLINLTAIPSPSGYTSKASQYVYDVLESAWVRRQLSILNG